MKTLATICLTLLALSGCRLATAPGLPHPGYPNALTLPTTDPNAVPALHVSGRVRGQNLVITARLDQDSEVMLEPYHRWVLGGRLDVDQDPATGGPQCCGPPMGWEYALWDAGGGETTNGMRVYDLNGNASAPVRETKLSHSYTVEIPLSSLGGDDGIVTGMFFISWRSAPDPTRYAHAYYFYETRRGAGPASPFEHIAAR